MMPTGPVVLMNIKSFQNYTHCVLAQQDMLSGDRKKNEKVISQQARVKYNFHFLVQKERLPVN